LHEVSTVTHVRAVTCCVRELPYVTGERTGCAAGIKDSHAGRNQESGRADKAITHWIASCSTLTNHCDLKTFDSLLADDVEFYHDQGGVTLGRQKLTESVKNNICTGDTQRVLVPGTLKITT